MAAPDSQGVKDREEQSVLSELEQKLQSSAARSRKPGGVFDRATLKRRSRRSRRRRSARFLAGQGKGGGGLARLKALKRRYDPWSKLRSDYDELKGIWRLAMEEKDESLEADLRASLEGLRKRYGELKVLELLGGDDESNSAFVTIRTGAGGTRHATGGACSFGCTPVGRTGMVTRSISSTCSRPKEASRASPSW